MTNVGEADRILDAALSLGEQRGWDAVHVYDIADHMQVGPGDIERHFRNKDEIAEAWFRRADHALASCANEPGWMDLSVRERLSRAMRAWFAALEPHKTIRKANKISSAAVPIRVSVPRKFRTHFKIEYDNGQVAEVSWSFIRELSPKK